MTSARSRIIEEQNQQAIRKQMEEERIKQLKKAREMGNNYSSSLSREGRSIQRAS
jgi:hypothetical protein